MGAEIGIDVNSLIASGTVVKIQGGDQVQLRPQMPDVFLLSFDPENSSPMSWYSHFGTDSSVSQRIQDISNHIRRSKNLEVLFGRLIPLLREQKEILNQNAFSSGEVSGEAAAVLESVVTKLYAVLDGIRDVLSETFGKNARGFKKGSTEALFSRAASGNYDRILPAEICDHLKADWSSWYPGFRELRSQVTHYQVGFVDINFESGKVLYINQGATNKVAEDFISDLNGYRTKIIELVHIVFKNLYEALDPELETLVLCGLYHGRAYQRKIRPTKPLTVNSGRCFSHTWFEKNGERRCLLADKCPAYVKIDDSEEWR